MQNENKKEIIKEFDEERMYVDETHSFPNYLLDYLLAYGIDEGYRHGSFYYKKDGFEREELEVITTDDTISFYSPSRKRMISEIRMNDNKNEVFYMDGFASSVHEYDDLGITYARDGRVYSLIVNTDPLGNVIIKYKHFGIEKEVIIRVGENYSTKKGYLKLLREQIDDTTIDNEIDLKIVDAMFDDPRILARIRKLMSIMAPDLATAYQVKANEIKAKYQDLIEELIKKQMEEVGKLTAYFDGYMKYLGNDSQDSEIRRKK